MTPKIVGAVWKNKSKGTPWRGPLRELAVVPAAVAVEATSAATAGNAASAGNAGNAASAGNAGNAASAANAGNTGNAASAGNKGNTADAVNVATSVAAVKATTSVARATAVAATAAVTVLLALAPRPAQAQGARVSAAPATADPEYATTLSLRGTGFQSVKNGYGGIYVFFGWVGGAWQPSKGGASGTTMRYVQDREAKDNNGYQRFISFPGGETEHAANGAVNADGTWSAQLNVPGARFKAAGREGTVSEVDCLKVTCGVITIGAHGVVNANNETFTPISFAVPNQPKPTTTTTPVTTATTTTTTPTTTTSTTTTTTTTQPEIQPAAQAEEDRRPGWLIPSGGAAVLLAAGLVWWLRFRRSRNHE